MARKGPMKVQRLQVELPANISQTHIDALFDDLADLVKEWIKDNNPDGESWDVVVYAHLPAGDVGIPASEWHDDTD